MRGLNRQKRPNRLLQLAGSSIGGKWIMALTGAFLLFFLLMHLYANLLVFAGPEQLNGYAIGLRANPLIIWGGRGAVLVAFVVHIAYAIKLTGENREARPVSYQHEATVQASWGSRYMLLTGGLIAAYVVFHLLHFTFHVVDTGGMDWEAGTIDPYSMVLAGFKHPLISLSYLAAQVVLFFHLHHAVGSMFQTVGLGALRAKKAVSLALPALICGGYSLVPLAIWFGVVK